METKEKEDIKEMFKDYGWSLRDLSEEYGISIRDVKEIIGEKNLEGHETNEETEHRVHKTISLNERREQIKARREARETKENLRAKTKTIDNFRAKGCALARCPKCGKPMVTVGEDAQGDYHYYCDNCGWLDTKDEVCKDACCRRGFAHLLYTDLDVEVDEEVVEAWVREGK